MGQVEQLLQRFLFFRCRDLVGVAAFVFVIIAADRNKIAIVFLWRKGIIDELEGDIGGVVKLFIIIGFPHKEVEVIYPVVAGIMNEDAHGTFVDDRVELFFLGGCGILGKVIKGEEAGIVFAELSFGPGDDHPDLLVGVIIIIVVGDIILDEVTELLEFLAVVGGFGGEDAVFPFCRFFQVIVDAYLAGGCPEEQNKYYR